MFSFGFSVSGVIGKVAAVMTHRNKVSAAYSDLDCVQLGVNEEPVRVRVVRSVWFSLVLS